MRAAFPLSIARPISLYTPLPLPLSGTTTALVCSRKKQRCIYSGREEGERWGEGALLVYFGAVLLNPMQKRKSLLRCLKRQMGPAFDAAFWVTSGGGGDAGREAGNSGRVAVTAAHWKFQKVTSHPWHIRSICMRRQRTAGQGDKRTAEGHVTSLSSHSPKVTIFKYFRVFFALLLLKFLS